MHSHEKETPRPTSQADWLVLGLAAAVCMAAILNFGLASRAVAVAFFAAAIGAGVSNGRARVIMTNAEKYRLTTILRAVLEEFAWYLPV
jgi:hypothetical protein